MIQRVRNTSRFAGVLLLLAGIAACAGRGVVPREYVLTPLSIAPGSGDVSAGLRGPAVGVGPVELPDYLRRPQIVTREDNRLEPSSVHRWAGDLRANFALVLAENLAMLIPTNQVVTFPWRNPGRLDYQVVVEVFRFERESGGEVSLLARWVLSRDRDVLSVGRSHVTEQPDGADYSATVKAMSRALGGLSREIATAIRKHAPVASVPLTESLRPPQ